MQTQSVEWFLLRKFYFFAWSRQSTGKNFTMESILFWSNRNASVDGWESNESFGSFEAYNQDNQMKSSYVYNVQKK